MNSFQPEQIAAAQTANLSVLFCLAIKAFEGVEKTVNLNLQTMRSTLEQAQENTKKALTVKDPQDMFALQAGLQQPFGETALSYYRQLCEIAMDTQAAFSKATEAEFEAHNRRLQELVDQLAHNAPAGSGDAVGALGSVITATNKLCETMYQTAKQAVELAEQNFNSTSSTASVAKQTVRHASRARA
ncbi:TIGR01841 family phasin [Cupriavidus basilensis]|uniref:TIGR01841 family phasin n=2 Tax=Cupriavidus basilensis TaxID=68895 RepID=A0ABT6AWP4_9BURK|nr:TIGR01841 family phasin [Cupriavidus basilensis]MDF3836904.1 TIGR01841 family phasin [Cupriavidus basilensis]